MHNLPWLCYLWKRNRLLIAEYQTSVFVWPKKPFREYWLFEFGPLSDGPLLTWYWAYRLYKNFRISLGTQRPLGSWVRCHHLSYTSLSKRKLCLLTTPWTRMRTSVCILTWVTFWDEWARFTPSEVLPCGQSSNLHWIGYWVDSREGIGSVQKRRKPYPSGELKPSLLLTAAW
jgi:hypothetical protein